MSRRRIARSDYGFVHVIAGGQWRARIHGAATDAIVATGTLNDCARALVAAVRSNEDV